MQESRPSTIYIAGYARSGSTVLDNILAQGQDVCSVGELRSIWKQGFIDGGLCGCGEPVRDCIFWREVFATAFNGSPPDPIEVFALQNRFLRARPRRLAQLIYGKPERLPRQLKFYIDIVAAIYRAASQVSGRRFIVDSSKTPIEPLALLRRGDLDMRVIHLVRDPRAVAYSVSRPKLAPDRPGEMVTRGPFDTGARWLMANGIAAYAVRRLARERYLICRYEDLTANPKSELEALGRFVGLAGAGEVLNEWGEGDLTPVHGAAGNPDRLRRRTVKVRPDDRWRHSMPLRDAFAASLSAAPLLPRYRYPVRPGRNTASSTRSDSYASTQSGDI